MLIDELVKESFDLDYEITYKQKAVDFLKEELKYIERDDIIELISKLTMKIQNLENLLKSCDNQRKNFRILLVNLMKEKLFYDEFIGENDSTILFKKLKIHEELKNKIINDNQNKIAFLTEKLSIPDKIIKTTIENLSIYTKPSPFAKNNIINKGNIMNKKEIKKKILNNLTITTDNRGYIKEKPIERLAKSPVTTAKPISPLMKIFNECKSLINVSKTKENQTCTSIEIKKESNRYQPRMNRKHPNEEISRKSHDASDKSNIKCLNELPTNIQINPSNLKTNTMIFKTKPLPLNKIDPSLRNQILNKSSAVNHKTDNLSHRSNNENKKKFLETIERDFYEHLSKRKRIHLTPILKKFEKLKNKNL